VFYPVFASLFEPLERAGALEADRFFAGCLNEEDVLSWPATSLSLRYFVLVPIDGTEYFRSSKIHWAQCSVTPHGKGKVSYAHKVLTPVIVAPGNPQVLALEPEFIGPQEGAQKQDCELNAAKRR